MEYRKDTLNRDAGSPTFAIITPSWAPDFERCQLLAESVQRRLPSSVHHYVIVDKCDRRTFMPIQGTRTHLVLKEDILPSWLIHVPYARRWWISLRGLPVRGWIVQQLAKLSANLVTNADVLVFVDSDAFFIRDYDPASMIREGKLPLFRQQKDELRIDWNTRWHQIAAELLGLPVKCSYDTSYVGHAVYWSRANLEKLQACIEKNTSSSWVESVSRCLYLSEYVLYGMYCDYVLRDTSGHYFRESEQSVNHWSEDAIDSAGLEELKSKIDQEVSLVMISAKAKVSTSAIRKAFIDQ